MHDREAADRRPVGEDAEAEIFFGFLHQVHGGFEDGVADEVVVVAGGDGLAGFIFDFKIHRAFEGLVDAVLGPGLGEGFQLDIGGLAVLFFEIILILNDCCQTHFPSRSQKHFCNKMKASYCADRAAQIVLKCVPVYR